MSSQHVFHSINSYSYIAAQENLEGYTYVDAYAHHRSDVQFDPVHGTNIQMEAELVEA